MLKFYSNTIITLMIQIIMSYIRNYFIIWDYFSITRYLLHFYFITIFFLIEFNFSFEFKYFRSYLSFKFLPNQLITFFNDLLYSYFPAILQLRIHPMKTKISKNYPSFIYFSHQVLKHSHFLMTFYPIS